MIAKTTLHLRDVPPSTYRMPTDGPKWRALCKERRALTNQLGSHADPDGTNIWVGRDRLAAALGFSLRTLSYRLADLVTLNFLRDEGWHGKSRRRSLDLQAIFRASERVQNSPVVGVGGPVHDSPDVCRIGLGRVQNGSGRVQHSAAHDLPMVDPPTETITPNGALSFWLKFKDRLKTELPKEEWDLWLRPLLFLKELGSKHLLLALPPVNRIMEAYKAREPWVRNRLGPLGYNCSVTRYPDEYELDKAVAMNPQWAEVRERLLRGKKKSHRDVA